MSAYLDFLSDPGRIEVGLLEVVGRNVANDSVATYRFSSGRFATKPDDSLANQRYDARIVGGFEMSAPLEDVSIQLSGLLPPRSGGDILLAQQYGDLDLGTLTQLGGVSIRDISFGGREARYLHGGYSPALGRWLTYDEFKVVFSGTCDGNPQIDDTTVTFTLSPKDRDFEYPLSDRHLWGLGYAGHFDGVNDYVNFGSHAAHDFTSGDFTLMVPFYYEAAPGAVARFWNRGTAATSGWQLELTTAGEVGLRTSQSGASQLTTCDVLPVGKWVWLTFRRVGANVVAFVDGEISVGSADGTHVDPATSSDDMLLGRNAGGSVFTRMMIGEARIYNYALTKQQISNEQHRPLDSTEIDSGLVFYARFNDGTGTTVADSSATGATGTASGMSWVHSCTGDASVTGEAMPDVFGPMDGWPPVLLDFNRQIFLISGEEISGVTRVETGGSAGMVEGGSSPWTSLMDFLVATTAAATYDVCITPGGTFLRLGDQPEHPVTVIGQGNAPGGVYLETASAQARWLVCNRGPNPLVDPTGLDTAAFDALDVANPAAIYSAWEGHEPLSAVLKYILGSVGAVGFFRRSNDLFSVERIEAVTTKTPVALTLTQNDVEPGSFEQLGRSTPIGDLTLRYSQNYAVMGSSEITPVVIGTAREAYLRRQWRTTRLRSASVRADYKDFATVIVETGLVDPADAVTEIHRLMQLYSEPDQSFRFLCRQRGVELDRMDAVYFSFADLTALGVRQSRYATSGSTAFLVLEVSDDAATGGKWITLWREST